MAALQNLALHPSGDRIGHRGRHFLELALLLVAIVAAHVAIERRRDGDEERRGGPVLHVGVAQAFALIALARHENAGIEKGRKPVAHGGRKLSDAKLARVPRRIAGTGRARTVFAKPGRQGARELAIEFQQRAGDAVEQQRPRTVGDAQIVVGRTKAGVGFHACRARLKRT